MENGANRRAKRRGKKKEKKGRIIGRMIISIRKDLEIQIKREREEKKVIMVGRIKYGKGSLSIVWIYMSGDMKKKLEELKEWMKEREEGVKTIIEGDFKARTRREGGGEYGGRRRRGREGKEFEG